MSQQLLLTFYGDDFTGSTDALEALATRGIESVLFLEPPTLADLSRFPGVKAVGVAGLSRSQSPQWMDRELPGVFEALRGLGAPLCHYKVCSTFDSSATHGSIGRAVEIGRRIFDTPCVPMIVGAPVLRRYVVFGNLFATVTGLTHRIDRHPTMSQHPVTPMTEADLRLHLSRQTNLPSASIDILALQAGRGLERYQECAKEGVAIALFDTLDAPSVQEAGRALWEGRGSRPCFVAGSSGVEYSLIAWWQSQGQLPPLPALAVVPPVERLLVLSGSCSPVTAMQINWALRNGFEGVALDAIELTSGSGEFERATEKASGILNAGGSPLLYSAGGPADVVQSDSADPGFGAQLGIKLGELAGYLVRKHGLQRTLIAGGDTSGHAGQALRIQALTMLRPFAPGSPLCRIWSDDEAVDGKEILLKGGQVGGEALFGDLRRGDG